MIKQKHWARRAHPLLLALPLSFGVALAVARTNPPSSRPQPSPGASPKKAEQQDDSVSLKPAKDLMLLPEGERKAEALAHFVEGTSFEENGETDKALEAYRKVLNVDPGQSQLASRVAALLTRQDNFPLAIDILKDAVKASPRAPEPYLQLAFIYAKYLKKMDQAVDYANRAIALDPNNISSSISTALAR